MKKIVAWVLALIFFFITIFIPDFSSFADGVVVVNSDDNTHYYLYNHFEFDNWSKDDFLTSGNYDDYFNLLDGNNKTEVVNKFVDSDYTYTIRTLNDFVEPDYTVTQGFNALGLYFLPIQVNGQIIPFEDCKAFIGIFSGSGSGYILLTLYLYYCPNGDDFVYSGDTIYCESPYYLTYQPFVMYQMTYNDTLHCSYSVGSPERISVSTVNSNTGYYQGTANSTQGCIFADFPYLFRYNTSYNNSLDTDYEVFQGYNNNNSLCVDRRTLNFINKINGITDDDNLLNDVNLMQFEGDLGFEYFDFKGYISENQGLIFPNYIVNYKLNNYTDLRKQNIEIYAKYNFDFKLTFQMAGNQMYGYQSANMGSMGFQDMLPVDQNTYGQDLNAYMDDNTFVNYRETAGLHLQSNGIRDYENIQYFSENSMISDFGRYFYQIMNNVAANKVVNSKRDSYFYITCEFWIEYVDENGRRIQSNKIIRKIDYWGDSSDPSLLLTPVVDDVDSSAIIDDDQAYHDFIDSYNYKKINEDTDGYLNYLPSTSNNSNQSSVGDITIYQNPYPYVLVDIPENQWLNSTPNLKTILTDFKTMLAETKEGSILNFFPEVYNYFPAPVWSYLVYGIGICLMIGIWRGITRR